VACIRMQAVASSCRPTFTHQAGRHTHPCTAQSMLKLLLVAAAPLLPAGLHMRSMNSHKCRCGGVRIR